MIIFICGSFGFKTETSRAQNKDVNKPGSTPAKTATPTSTQNNSSMTNNSNNSSEQNKSIIILDFYNVSPQCRDKIYGQNIATQLTTAFVNGGEYTVIEKERLDKVIEEIGLSYDELRDPANAAKVGKVLSANTVVLGTIIQCSPDTDKIATGPVKAIIYSVEVSVSIRLVDINSAKILDAVNMSEKADERSGCLPFACKEKPITPDLQIKLFNKAVGNLVKKAVQQLSSIIRETPKTPNPTPTGTITPQTPQTQMNSMAKIVAVNGTTIYITGLGNSVKVGDIVSILRGKEIKNATTGEVIDFDGKEIAKAEITEVNENTVKAQIIKGVGVKELDFIKLLK
jgi:curli biogenesis system outer membrane secretion channel CsgG